MSKLKNVGIVIHSLKIPQQTYEHLITFFNLYDDPAKVQEVLTDNRFDLFGFLPKGFFFKDEKTVERVVNTFNVRPRTTALLIYPPLFNKECPYFINKKILEIDEPIKSLSEMLSLVERHGLAAGKSTEELFIYEH